MSNIICGVDSKGAEFIGNKLTHSHAEVGVGNAGLNTYKMQ